MPDVGVLNLQIHSESTQAENSLRRLEGALLAIKQATNGTGLAKVASALAKINQSVNVNTYTNLNAVASALKKIQDACNFTVPNLSGLNRVRQTVDRMASSAATIGQMRNSVNEFAEGFATAETRVSGATNKVNEFGNAVDKVFSMVGNGKFEQFNRMFDAWEKMRSARSLGAGENTGVSTSVEKGWTAWKNGAIEVEGTVSDAMGNIVGYIESAGEKVQSGNETVANAFRQTGTSVSEMRMRTEMYFSSIKNRIAELSEQWIGAIQKARELGESMKKIYETPGVSDSKKKEAFAEYRTATDNVRALLEEMKAVDRQATETAQKLGISYESITASVERHTQAVYEDARQQMKAVNTQKHFEYQTRHLDYYQQNFASMSELDKKNFKEMYANDPAMTSAIEQIERMAAAQENLNDEQSRATGAYGIDTKAIENGIAQLGEARQRITQINKDFEEAVKRMEETGGVMPRVDTSALDQAYNDVTAFINDMSMSEATAASTIYELEDKIRSLAAAEEEMKKQMAAAIAAGLDPESEAAQRQLVAIRMLRGEQEQLITQMVELQQQQSVSYQTTEAVKADFEALGSVVTKILSPLKNLAKQFVNIARRMAIRAVIRQFTDGIREGVENMYWWSKANNTDFAPSLDHLATSLKDLTNSLGAMAAEVLTAVMPVLEQIIDKVIEGVNWLNQFFAALQGKNTWMKYERGSETTKMFDDTKKAASGASKAMKELLADWDELNIIQSESSRGGGSGSSYKWSEENTGKYTETPIGSGPAAAAKFVNENWVGLTIGGIGGVIALAALKSYLKNRIFTSKVAKIVSKMLEENGLAGKNGEKTGMEKAKQAAEEAKETTEQAKQATEQAKDAVDEATSKVDEVIEQNKPEHLAEVTVEKAKIEDATVDRLLDKTDIKRLEAGSDTPPRPLGLDDIQQNTKRLMDATLQNNMPQNTEITRALDLVEKGFNRTIPSLNQANISYLNDGIARLTEGSKLLSPAQESTPQNLQLEAARNIGKAGQEMLRSAEEIKAIASPVANGVAVAKEGAQSAEMPKLNAAQTVLDTSNRLIADVKDTVDGAKLLTEGAKAQTLTNPNTVNLDKVDTVKLTGGVDNVEVDKIAEGARSTGAEQTVDALTDTVDKEFLALKEQVVDALGEYAVNGPYSATKVANDRLWMMEHRLETATQKIAMSKEEAQQLLASGYGKEQVADIVKEKVDNATKEIKKLTPMVEEAKENVGLARKYDEAIYARRTANITSGTSVGGTGISGLKGPYSAGVFDRTQYVKELHARDALRLEETRASFPNLIDMVKEETEKQYNHEISSAWDRINEAARGEGPYNERGAIPLLESEQETLEQIRRATEEAGRQQQVVSAMPNILKEFVRARLIELSAENNYTSGSTVSLNGAVSGFIMIDGETGIQIAHNLNNAAKDLDSTTKALESGKYRGFVMIDSDTGELSASKTSVDEATKVASAMPNIIKEFVRARFIEQIAGNNMASGSTVALNAATEAATSVTQATANIEAATANIGATADTVDKITQAVEANTEATGFVMRDLNGETTGTNDVPNTGLSTPWKQTDYSNWGGTYTDGQWVPFDIENPVDWNKELVAYKYEGVPIIFRKSDLNGSTDWSTMDFTYVKQGNTGGFLVHPQQDLTAGEKLQSLIFRGENFLAQHGTEIMAALLIAQGVGSFAAGKYVEEKAYEEVYGDRYTSLSALAKLRVRQEGGNLEPEDAQASINRWKETVKNFLPGAFLDWLPETAEAAYGRMHGVAVVAGQGAKPIMETAGSIFEWAYEMIDSLGGLLETPKMQYEKEQKAGTIASEYVAQDPTLTALKDDIAKLVSEGNKYGDMFDISVWSSALSMGENLQDWLYKNLAVNLGWGSDNDANVVAFKKIFDETGMSMWDILPDELKNKYIDYVFQYLGDDFKVVDKRLKEELGVPFADLFSMYRKEDMWDVFSNEGKKSFIQYYSGLYSGSEVLKGLASGGVGLEELLPIMMMFPDSTWQGALRPLSDLYGYENLEDLLYSQYGINLSDFYVPEGKSGKYWTPDQLYAGGAWNGYGVKPSNWGEYNGEETDTAKDVQDGTKAANAELEEQGDETNRLLRQLIQTLVNKQFIVTPSSAWGDHNAKSEGFWANITGAMV